MKWCPTQWMSLVYIMALLYESVGQKVKRDHIVTQVWIWGHLSLIEIGHKWISLFTNTTCQLHKTERADNNQTGQPYRVESVWPELVLTSADQTNYYFWLTALGTYWIFGPWCWTRIPDGFLLNFHHFQKVESLFWYKTIRLRTNPEMGVISHDFYRLN